MRSISLHVNDTGTDRDRNGFESESASISKLVSVSKFVQNQYGLATLVPVTIVVDIVVAGQHQLTTKPNRQGEQDL